MSEYEARTEPVGMSGWVTGGYAFAIVMLVWAFGWTGGKQLVRESYGQAKDKVAEEQAARHDRKLAKKNHETTEEAT